MAWESKCLENGVLFHAPTTDALVDSLQSFDASDFDPQLIRAHAERFDTRVFQEAITARITATPP